MEGLSQILVLALFMLAGALLPRLRVRGRPLAPPPRAVDLVLKLVLRALLLLMGFRIGNDGGLSARLAEIGLLGACAGLLATAGSLAALLAAFALLGPRVRRIPAAASGLDPGARPVAPARPSLVRRLKEPAALVSFVAAGFLLGLVLPGATGIDIAALGSWILDALLFLIGMQFSQSGVSLKGAFLEPAVLVVPLATAAGTLGAGLLLAPLFGLGAGKALALVGGFGWYSLSGVLIADLGDPALGSAAFLANMARELLALLSIPFLSRSALPQLAIGVGGATAMDVTLPLIEEGAGPGIVPASFASGALLSLAVPLIVPLFYRLG